MEKHGNFGKAKSEEHKQAISKACMGIVKTKNRSKKCKEICQYDINYNLICVYPSIMEAHRQTGIAQPNISACVSGRLHSAGGYFWSLN